MSKSLALREDAATETFNEVKRLICHTVHQFRQRNPGGDLAEMMADAQGFMFMIAFEHYDGRASFATYVRWVVWKGLLEQRRTEARHATKLTYNQEASERANFYDTAYLFDLLDSLTEEGKIVVKLALNTPAELANAILEKGGAPINYRSSIKQYLRDSLGWTANQIAEAFHEIKEAL